MPHLVILYTPNLDQAPDQGGTDMSALCHALAQTMAAQRDELDKAVFPPGGVRVLAYPAAHFAVADGGEHGGPRGHAAGYSGKHAGYAFVYLNLRMAGGRSDATKKRAGDALLAVATAHFDHLIKERLIGITLQVDESPGQVYDGKHSNLHPLFQKT